MPEVVTLHDMERSYQIFLYMEAFEWRFLPSQLLREDADLMHDLLTIRSVARKIEKQQNKKS